MLLKTIRLVRRQWAACAPSGGSLNHFGGIPRRVIARLFTIPACVRTIWVSIYTTPSQDRWGGLVTLYHHNLDWPRLEIPGAAIQSADLDAALRPYVGKRVYIGVEYEEVTE
jgi:hypothetical protein